MGAAQNQCALNPAYMRTMCKLSCGICGTATPTPGPAWQTSSPLSTPPPTMMTPSPTMASTLPPTASLMPTPAPAWLTAEPTPSPAWVTAEPTPSPPWMTVEPTVSPISPVAPPVDRALRCSADMVQTFADIVPICGIGQTCYARSLISTCYGGETECCSGGVIAACVGAQCVALEEITTCSFGSVCCAPRVLTCLGSCPSYPQCLSA